MAVFPLPSRLSSRYREDDLKESEARTGVTSGVFHHEKAGAVDVVEVCRVCIN